MLSHQALRLAAEQKEVLLLLALHREVTMSALHPMPPPVRTAMVSFQSCLSSLVKYFIVP